MNCKAGSRGGEWQVLSQPPRTLGEEWAIIVIRSSENVSLDTEEGWVALSLLRCKFSSCLAEAIA